MIRENCIFSTIWGKSAICEDTMATTSLIFDIVLKSHESLQANLLQNSSLMLSKIKKLSQMYLENQICLSLKCKAMTIMSIFTVTGGQDEKKTSLDLNSFEYITDIIYKNTSKFKVSEPERMAAASSLEITGAYILTQLKSAWLEPDFKKVLYIIDYKQIMVLTDIYIFRYITS